MNPDPQPAVPAGRASRPPGAVVIGGYINGLGLIRSLAARHIPVAVVTTQSYDIAQHSRDVCARAEAYGLEDCPQALVDLLEQRAEAWAGWALFPTNDGALTALARHRDQLSSRYRVVAPSWDVARHFLDKDLMRSAAQAVGIAVPRCHGPATASAAATLSGDLLPVLVKPVEGHRFFARFGCKLFVARNRPELVASVARVEQADLACRIIDLIPGSDGLTYAYCAYLNQHGEASAGITVRKIRQSPPLFGVARVAEIVPDLPGLREMTIELVRRLGFRGMAAAEFKWDSRDGTLRFIEVNGRSVLYNLLLRRGGLDLGGLAWADYVGDRPDAARLTGWAGVWVNLHADLLYSALCRRHHPVGVAGLTATYRRPLLEAVWSPRDPRPFLAQWWHTARDGASAVWRGNARDVLEARRQPSINV